MVACLQNLAILSICEANKSTPLFPPPSSALVHVVYIYICVAEYPETKN
jgi:hypothetical protein